MSPEQSLSLQTSSRSDLSSPAGVLYKFLTAKPPFLARSLPELLRKHQNTPPIPIRSIRPEVPENLEYVVADLLLIRPESRPRNALLVVKRLQSLLQALVGDPAEINVLPTSSETPICHREPISHFLDGAYQPTPYLRDNTGDDNVVDLDNVLKPENDALPDGTVLLPESEFSDSFQCMGTGQSIEEASTIAFLPTEFPAGSDSSPLQNSAGSAFLADTTTAPAVRNAKEDFLAANPPQEPVKPPQRATRFTAVESADFDSFDEERSRPVVSLPTALASIALMIVGLVVYYLIQPVTPEVLFKRITATVRVDESANGYDPASLRSARSNIQYFMNEYENHPLAEQVEKFQDELVLLEYERRLERRTLRDLSPVERAYVGILAISPYDSEQTIDKLRAFIDVFHTVSSVSEESAKPPRFTSSPVETCVELARRRLKKLEQDVEEINAAQKQVLRRRLDEAADWDTKNPLHAEEIRRGVIELYQDYRWAKELVEETKQHLEK